MKCEPASKLSLVSGNYHEPAEPVVMVMASIDVKIRHVFADTPLSEESIGAAPPGNNIAQCLYSLICDRALAKKVWQKTWQISIPKVPLRSLDSCCQPLTMTQVLVGTEFTPPLTQP